MIAREIRGPETALRTSRWRSCQESQNAKLINNSSVCLASLFTNPSSSQTHPPVQENRGDQANSNNKTSYDTGTAIEPNVCKHLGEPERTDETPHLTNKGNEYAYTGGLFTVAIHCIRDQDGGHDLVACAGDRGAHQRRDIPGRTCLFEPDQENDDTDDSEYDTAV